MKLRIVLLVIVLISAFFSCGQNEPVKQLVTNFLSENAGIDAASIKITEYNEPTPWLASDSLIILRQEFDEKKQEMMGHLEASLMASKKAVEEAEKVKSSGYSMLSDMAEETIKESMMQIEMAEAFIKNINGNCRDTPLEGLYNKIQDYEIGNDAVLFQKITGKWSDGDLEQAFNLRADPDLKLIVGILAE